jgi:Mpv17 / PMP22 family
LFVVVVDEEVRVEAVLLLLRPTTFLQKESIRLAESTSANSPSSRSFGMAGGNGRANLILNASRSCSSTCISRRSQELPHCKFCASLCICFVLSCFVVSSVEWKMVNAFAPILPHQPVLDSRSVPQLRPTTGSHRCLFRTSSCGKTQLSMAEGDPLVWMAPLMASGNIPNVWLNSDALVTQACTAAFFAGLGDIIAQSIASSQPNENQRRLDGNGHLTEERGEMARDGSTKEPVNYDPRRTMNYFLKGLGGGCMWSGWFLVSDPMSLGLTHRILEATFLHSNTELGFAFLNGDIDVATAASNLLFTVIPMHLESVITISGRDLQHLIRVFLCIALEQFFVSPLFFTLWDIPIPALLSGSPLRQIPAQIQAKLFPLLVANAKVWTPANVITYSLPTEHRVLFASLTDLLWQTILSQITSNEITLRPPPPIPKEPLPEFITSTTADVNIASSTSTTSANSPIPTAMVSNQVSSVTTPIPSGPMTSTTLFQTNGSEK